MMRARTGADFAMTHPEHFARLQAACADLGVGKYERASRELEELARLGESQALLQIGWMHEQGLGRRQNAEEALRCYEALAEMGNRDASYYVASLRFRQGDAVGALPHFLRAAEAGNPSAAYWAAAIYGGEKGFPVDAAKEALLLDRAAELGHLFAQRDLARRRMSRANGVREKLRAFADWMRIKGRGLRQIVLDVEDLRVR